MGLTTPFTYNPQNPTDADIVRQLIPDTTNTLQQPAIFNDYEINNLFTIQARVFQSSMFYSPPAGRNIPMSPVSLLRVAAIGIDIIASNSAQLALITKLLDVNLNPAAAAKILTDRADKYRQIDDESGAFAIIEQVNTTWAFYDRYFKQIQRQTGGGGGA